MILYKRKYYTFIIQRIIYSHQYNSMKNTFWIHEFNIMVQNRTNTDKLENSIFNWEVLSWQTRTFVGKFFSNETFDEKFPTSVTIFQLGFQVKKKLFNINFSIIKFCNFWIFPTRTLVGNFL